MGILDFIKGELLEIIEWTDDSRDTLCYRFPDDDKAIKRGAQLIVRESQTAQFVYLGEFGDTFGPGKHSLTTDNIPILTRLKSWKYGFESPFKADVYYINTRLFTGNKCVGYKIKYTFHQIGAFVAGQADLAEHRLAKVHSGQCLFAHAGPP